MNKQEFVTILQSALLTFDGMDADEIMKLNPEYDFKYVKIGIKLCDYLLK